MGCCCGWTRVLEEALSGLDEIQLPVPTTDYADNIYWVFGIVLRDPDRKADDMMKKLGEKGIGTRHFFYPMHKQPALIKEGCCKEEYLNNEQFKNANYICEHGFYIPSGVGITFEEQNYVIECIRRCL